MPTVKFLLQQPYERTKNGTRKPATKETRLYAFLIIDHDHVIKCKTEHVIRPSQWDFDTQGLNDHIAGSPEFNEGLATLRKELLAQFKELRAQYPDATFKEIADMLKEQSKSKNLPAFSEKNFFEVLNAYIEALEGEVEHRTIQKFHTLKLSLTEFSAGNKRYNPLAFSLIDQSFLRSYVKHLRSQAPRGRQLRRPEGLQDGLLNATIGKYIECLKNFCNWAEEEGYNKNHAYDKFKTVSAGNKKRKPERRDIVTLTFQELTKFYLHDFSERPALDRVRDIFCFAAFTAQRWSDIERFNKDDLKGNVWAFTAFKTKKLQEIDLTDYAATALDILKKYDYKLPVISLQKFNEELKDAGKEAGITVPVKLRRYSGVREIITEEPKYYFMSSHLARRTAVSILLNVFGVPPSLVMEITGHTDIKTLQKYINTDREARKAAMSRTTPVTETMRIVKSA